MHPFLLTKLTEASKSQKIDSKFSTKTKTKTFQNLNMPPPLVYPLGPVVLAKVPSALLSNFHFVWILDWLDHFGLKFVIVIRIYLVKITPKPF